MKEMLYIIIGGLFSGVIIYIVKGFFVVHENRTNQIESLFNEKVISLEEKIDKISEGHINVYNNLLDKFSKWEDRIKKIIDDSELQNNSLSSSNLKYELIDMINELDVNFKKDIYSVRYDISQLQDILKSSEYSINTMNMSESDKKAIKDIVELVIRLERSTSLQIDAIEDKLMKMFSMCKTIVLENKEIEKKLSELKQSSKSKIRLIE